MVALLRWNFVPALRTVVEITREGITPSALEMFDGLTLRTVEEIFVNYEDVKNIVGNKEIRDIPLGAIGIYSYYVSAAVRVKVLSPIQFGLFFLSLVALYGLDSAMYKGARIIGEPRWGRMPERSQYALIAITVTFTWLMGMLGYMRAGARQYWHVYGIMKNTSPDAYLPTHGYASIIVTIVTLLFLLLISFVFWSIMKLEKVLGERKGN